MSSCSKRDPLLPELSRDRRRVLCESGVTEWKLPCSWSWERSANCGRNGPAGAEVNAAGGQEALGAQEGSSMQPRSPQRSGPSPGIARTGAPCEDMEEPRCGAALERCWASCSQWETRSGKGPHVEQGQSDPKGAEDGSIMGWPELLFPVSLCGSGGGVRSRWMGEVAFTLLLVAYFSNLLVIGTKLN